MKKDPNKVAAVKKANKNDAIELVQSLKDNMFEPKNIINIGNADLGRYLFMHEKAIKSGSSSSSIRANYRAILKELRSRDQ
tara:strand:- start:61 stop:303 length:243 start_codon:yes stop_codon:yes gene_type:complete